MGTRDDTPGDLLFGLLALQNGWVDQGQLVAAFREWTRGGGRSLDRIFLDGGLLDAEACSILHALAAKQLELHLGDPARSLAGLPVQASTREALGALGDPELTASVDFLPAVPPPVDAARARPPASAETPRFRPIRPHAQGGLGAVFLALDGELNREVALKQILDHHADDPARRARFLLEAEITGGLEHPGIVPVYGLGRHQDGRPYYAMRFIRGDSLKEAIASFHGDPALKNDPGKRALALRGLLRRFVDVCNAIDYAHGRGIIHRDLKPSNVIVGKHGETLVVDWGLAKSIGHSEAAIATDERTLVPQSYAGSSETLPGAAMGTPAFMSPEQAAGDLDQIGPRSDVYSLGATLYCLLCGRAPLEGFDIGSTLRRIIRGDFEPPRHRNPAVHPALEAICLKAMALRPEDRYQTVRGLAEDLERWTADQPVSAYREPLQIRAARWVRRHKTLVTTASAAGLVALIGLLGVLAVQTQAKHALEVANGELRRANRGEAAANAGLRAANALALARFDLAREAIRSFQAGVTEDEMLKGDDLRRLRDKLLRSAAGFYQKLDQLLQGQTDRPSRKILAQSYFELGDLTKVIGIQPEALAIHNKALAIRRELLAGLPEADEAATLDVARSLIAVGMLAEATGDARSALTHFEEARDLARSSTTMPDATIDSRAVLGTSYLRSGPTLWALGQHAGAQQITRKALVVWEALSRAHPENADYRVQHASCYSNLSVISFMTGQGDEAIRSVTAATSIFRQLVADFPENGLFSNRLAISLYNLAAYHQELGHLDQALVWFLESRMVQESLVAAYPAVSEYRDQLGFCLYLIARAQVLTGQAEVASESCRRALDVQQRLVLTNSANAQYRFRQAETQRLLGKILLNDGRPRQATVEIDRSCTTLGDLTNSHPGTQDYEESMALSEAAMGDALRDMDEPGLAQERYSRAVAALERLTLAGPQVPTHRSHLAATLRRLALLEAASGDRAKAQDHARRAVALFEGLPTRSGSEWFDQACARLTLAVIVNPGFVAAGPEAVPAVIDLRQAIAAGFRDAPSLQAEAALAPVRCRADVQLILLDAGFPTDPFMPTREPPRLDSGAARAPTLASPGAGR